MDQKGRLQMSKFTSKTQTDEAAIFGGSDKGFGVQGQSKNGQGGNFHSDNKEGLYAETNSAGTAATPTTAATSGAAAIAGIQLDAAPTTFGAGVYGESRGGGAGIAGFNWVESPTLTVPGGPGGPGGFFHSEQKEGVFAETMSTSSHAIVGKLMNPSSTGAGIYGEHPTDGTAGFFKGNVIVTGDITFSPEVADISEDFTIKDEVLAEAGTVMALNGTGELVPCVDPYEKKVVGVVAGAGSLRPGIIMGKQEGSAVRRQPIALVGKVFCKVDASYGSIEVGALLTSSATPGHAMKASDPTRAFGTVIGKAMAPLGDGLGLIPILISLQ
jgi:hypothetical protein